MRRSASKSPTLHVDVCACGHYGAAAATRAGVQQHATRYGDGHGPCLMLGCDCQQFTWDHFKSVPLRTRKTKS